jgi:hypothetical protein
MQGPEVLRACNILMGMMPHKRWKFSTSTVHGDYAVVVQVCICKAKFCTEVPRHSAGFVGGTSF